MFTTFLINFAIYIGVGTVIGGDAFNGKVENGHYYVMWHGKYTEVSSAVWHYSRIHTISIFITFFLVLLCAWVTDPPK